MGRPEAAGGVAHLAQQVVERFSDDTPVRLAAGDLPGVQVGAGELGVVIEHLFEMGDQPAPVRRVAVEAATQLVVDATGRHPVQSPDRHREGVGVAPQVAAQQQLDAHRLRELGGRREAAPIGVESARVALYRTRQERFREGFARGRRGRGTADRFGHPAAGVDQVGPARPPGFGDGRQQAREAWQAVPVDRREVGAGIEGFALRRQEDGHRPPALAGHRLHGVHVDRVDVRPLFAIHLDAHEAVVHELRGRRVLEGLALHHVAPVAGRVADREQDRLVLRPSPVQRLGTPLVPVDGVVGVLQEIGAGGLGQPVGHISRLGLREP